MRRFINFKFKNKNNMLKANELRIGNLVQSYADIISVEYVDKLLLKGVFHRDLIYNTSIQIKHCKPIEITKEWLIKCGFVEVDNNIFQDDILSKSIRLSNTGIGCYISDVTPTIEYVHQLQNLYFALTGIELELSSNVA